MVWYVALDATAQGACGAALRTLEAQGQDMVALDREAPDGIGVVFLSSMAQAEIETVQLLSRAGLNRILAFVVASRTISTEMSWHMLAAGASDVLHWHDGAAEIAAARLARWAEIDRIISSELVASNLVGRSPAWIKLLREVVEVACFSTAPVLIIGESGTGKELIARLIHTLDRRQGKKKIVVVDCTTIVPDLAGSEFFGHEKGAFTNAMQAREGAFALANGGTLFLDEIGELPPPLQSQLLRAVQEKTYKRVGGNDWRKTDFRLVCATNRDLVSDVQKGGFRKDLFHRLASWTIRVPPLRERQDDALVLARHFLAELLDERPVPQLDDAVRHFLLTRSYEGNVRDLRQLLVRISGRYIGSGPIGIGDIPEEERLLAAPQIDMRGSRLEEAVRFLIGRGVGLKEIGREATDAAVRIALSESASNLQRAARLLGVTDRALQIRSSRGSRIVRESSRPN